MKGEIERPTRLVIVGASGQLGAALVPHLAQAGFELLLVGRDAARLKAQYPAYDCHDLASWMRGAQGYDAIINFAVMNNAVSGESSVFEEANCHLAVRLAEQAAAANIKRFIQISSVHALDTGNSSNYARSKRCADDALDGVEGVEVVKLYLAAVWGARWSGSLSGLNRLPRWLALILFGLLSALKPTVHVEEVRKALIEGVKGVGGRRRIVVSDIEENRWYRLFCALRDYGFALSTLVLFWWALILIWMCVRLGSRGPGVFSQLRVGKKGKIFTCYKFRTMYLGTKQAGTHEVGSGAITPVGAFLRRTKLDELPQVLNILKGEIRLVGPRPCLPGQVELLQARHEQNVLSIKPGITGWAQIHDVDMSGADRLAWWDAQYIGLRGVVMDTRIVLATATGRGMGDRISQSVN